VNTGAPLGSSIAIFVGVVLMPEIGRVGHVLVAEQAAPVEIGIGVLPMLLQG
jgi:hypothetical protein